MRKGSALMLSVCPLSLSFFLVFFFLLCLHPHVFLSFRGEKCGEEDWGGKMGEKSAAKRGEILTTTGRRWKDVWSGRDRRTERGEKNENGGRKRGKYKKVAEVRNKPSEVFRGGGKKERKRKEREVEGELKSYCKSKEMREWMRRKCRGMVA